MDTKNKINRKIKVSINNDESGKILFPLVRLKT